MSSAQVERRHHAPGAMAVALVCVAWLFLAAWGASQYRQATHRGPVLYAPLSVAVDANDGTIYCASGAGRVHLYGPDGRGRGAFVVETEGAPFRVSIEGPGRVALAVDGLARVRVYDEGGRVIEERDEPGAFARFAAAESARAGTPGVKLDDLGAIIDQRDDAVEVLVPALPFPLSFFAAAPWTIVFSLFFSTLGLMAAFVWPFLARSE